ncbi:MAG: FG-GAP repeat protein [Planctomycetes bacterium]|nr:FG-GAP repeat protein [Planctomycetota bacterium]
MMSRMRVRASSEGHAWIRRSSIAQRALLWFPFLVGSLAGGTDSLPVVLDLSRVDERLLVESRSDFDELGRDVAGLGDLDGDGFEDLGFFGGHVPTDHGFILRGAHPLPAHLDPDGWQEWGIRIESPTGHSSCSPVPVGDLDRDGFADISFAFWADDPQVAGVRILFGSEALPQAIDADAIGSGLRGLVVHADPQEAYHSPRAILQVMASLDANGDGWEDLAVSAPTGDDGAGVVYVVFGGPSLGSEVRLCRDGARFGGTCIRATNPFNSDDWKRQRLGSEGASAGDVNGDGYDDLLICAPGWDHGAEAVEVGAVFLVLGRPDCPSQLDLQEETGRCCRFFGSHSGVVLGQSGSYGAGDLNGDGLHDIAFNVEGRVRVVFGTEHIPVELALDDSSSDLSIATHEVPSPRIYGRSGGDFDGDGLADLVVVAPWQRTSRWAFAGTGVAYVLYGRPGLRGTLAVAEGEPYTLIVPSQIPNECLGGVGHVELSRCDLNGDGIQDLAIGAPSNRPGVGERTESRLYVLYGACDQREPLAAIDFAPTEGDVKGGTDIQVRGAGFTSATEVYFDGIPAPQCQRIDSRTLLARTPPSASELPAEVSVRDGPRTVRFPAPFRYTRFAVPPQFRLDSLGAAGTVVVNDDYLQGEALPFKANGVAIGGCDVDGDGHDDVVFHSPVWLRPDLNPDGLLPGAERVFILYGAASLPPQIGMSEFGDYGVVLWSESPWDGFGRYVVPLGDCNGDGRGDIAVWAYVPGVVYVIFGTDFGKGDFEVERYVFQEGGGVVVQGLPHPDPAGEWPDDREGDFSLHAVGDVDGDGSSDLAIVDRNAKHPDGSRLGSIRILLSRRGFCGTIEYADLPVIYGRVPENGYWARAVSAYRIGDIDGDGLDDIGFVGQALKDSEVQDQVPYYEVYVLFGRQVFRSRSSIEEELASNRCLVLAVAPAERDLTGHVIGFAGSLTGMSRAGDQNEDGFDDMLLVYGVKASGTGAVHLAYGDERPLIRRNRELGEPIQFDATFLSVPGYTGIISHCDGGEEFDDDGRPDLLLSDLSCWWPSVDRGPPGRIIVAFGTDFRREPYPLDELPRSTVLEDWRAGCDNAPYVDSPNQPAFVGDFNGDGLSDIATATISEVVIWYSPSRKVYSAFHRGDANQDRTLDLADPIFILDYLFAAGALPSCLDAADVNDSESLEIGDPIYLLNFLFASGEVPPEPFGRCGMDPAGDALDCKKAVCDWQ